MFSFPIPSLFPKDTRILLFLEEHYTIKVDIIRNYLLLNSTETLQLQNLYSNYK